MNTGNIKELAIKLAYRYAKHKHEYVGTEPLYAVVLHEDDKMWRCYVSNKMLDDSGEHIIIEYTINNGEAFIQYYYPEDDDSNTLFIWIDKDNTDEVDEITIL